MEEEKQKFIDIMEKIRIGSIILYSIGFGDKMTAALEVNSIRCCDGLGKGCEYCKGVINDMCFKKSGSYESVIIEVIDSNFITIEEMKI